MKTFYRLLFLAVLQITVLELFSQSSATCIPVFQNGVYDTYITNVSFGGINNSHATTMGSPDYTYFSNQVAEVDKGQSYVLSVSSEVFGSQSNLRAFIDFDGDGVFEPSNGEQFDFGEAGGTSTLNITIPMTAVSGFVRLRVVANEENNATPCVNDRYGEGEDYQLSICDGTQMSFLNANGVVSSTSVVLQGGVNQQALAFNYKTQGCANPYTINSMDFNIGTSSSTADLASAKLFYNNTNDFSIATQVGNVVNNPNTNFSITGIQNDLADLKSGDNFFWLVYDIAIDAINKNVIDGEIIAINTNENGSSTNTVTNPNPTGTREIVYQQCIPIVATGGAANDFELNSYTLANFTSRASADGFNSTTARGYNNYSAADSLTLCAGSDYNFTANVVNNSTTLQPYLHFWADWNQDGDFDEKNEHQLIATAGLAIGAVVILPFEDDFPSTIHVPANASNGYTVTRIGLSQYARNQTCGNFPIGEFDDILIRVNSLESTTPLYSYNESGDSITLNSNTNATNFTWQQSTDLNAYTDVAGSNNASTINVEPNDNVQSFRYYENVAACPNDVNANAIMYSEIIEVLKVGLDSVVASNNQVCQGDSTQLIAYYDFRKTQFTSAPDGAIIDQGDVYSDVIAINSTRLVSSYNLNSVCINVTASLIEDLSFELIAPDGSKVLLTDGSSVNAANTTYDFCLKQDTTLNNIEAESAALQGNYQPLNSWSNLTGLDANGDWTLSVLSSNANVDAVLNSWTLNFGFNDSVNWTNSTDFLNPDLDTAMTQVNSTQFFTANLTNSLVPSGLFKDSIEVIARSPGSTQITDIVSNDGDLLFCSGIDKHYMAILNTPLIGDNFVWYINDVIVAGENTDSLITNTISNGDELKVEFVLNDACGAVYTVDSITVNERPEITPNVSLSSSVTFPLCNPSNFTLSASYIDTNSTTQYSWKLNGVEVAQKVNSFNFSGLSNGDSIIVSVSNTVCNNILPHSDTLIFRVNNSVNLIASIQGFAPQLCEGSINLLYDTTGNNANGQFEWFLNGQSISSSNNITLDSLTPGTYNYGVTFTPSVGCFNQMSISENGNFEVLSNEIPSVDISADKNILCPGEGTVLRAVSVVNGGDQPRFKWYQNGNLIPFQNKNTLVINSQNNAKRYYVELISNYICSSISTVQSNQIIIDVQRDAQPKLNLQRNSPLNDCEDGRLNLAATNVGTTPVSYIWTSNGVVIPGQSNSTLDIARTLGVAEIKVKSVSNLVCSGLDTIPALESYTFNTFEIPDSTFDVNIFNGEYIATSNANITPNTTVKWYLNGVFFAAKPETKVVFTEANNNLCMEIDNGTTCFAESCQSFSFVGVNDLNNTEHLSLYPNPAQNTLNIVWPAAINNQVSYSIVNSQGKTVLSAVNNNGILDVSQLSKGSYIVKAISQNNYAVSRFEKL